MSRHSEQVNRLYGRDHLSDQILSALADAGKDVNHLTRDDLSTFDEFHIGGVVETRNLAGKVPNLKAGAKVLDIGSGLGGPARTLAEEFNCKVVGIDLTSEYCNAARKLTDLVGLSQKVTFQLGDALDMPFDEDDFDVVWTQFVGMNIEDKEELYKQVHRVVREGGHFAFHEVMAGNQSELIFPVFWADTEETNFLRPPDAIRQLLRETGFQEVYYADLTQHSSEWFERILEARAAQSEKPALGFNVFVGESTPQKAANIIRNLREDRIRVVQAVYQAKA